jgi:hypothetical protein
MVLYFGLIFGSIHVLKSLLRLVGFISAAVGLGLIPNWEIMGLVDGHCATLLRFLLLKSRFLLGQAIGLGLTCRSFRS